MYTKRVAASFGICLVLACPVGVVAPSAGAEADQVMVRTESGKVRCLVSVLNVVCQRQSGETFPDGPMINGYRANQASVRPSGQLNWFSAQLPAIGPSDPQFDTVMTYGQALSPNGWTIDPSPTGTRFTSQQTGRGMVVSIDGISTF
jgi:hypothetical protein